MNVHETKNKKLTKTEQRELIEQSKKDPSAFGQIYDACFDQIFHYVLHRTGNVAIAEDLTAQTFYNALNNLWKFRWTGASITAWLYRIATNEVNNHYRGERKKSHADIDTLSHQIADENNRPDRELEEAEEIVAQHGRFLMLNRYIKKLKPEEQTLITLRYFEKKPFKEIAEILKKKEGTLRMRTKRSLEKLKVLLEKQGIENEDDRRVFSPNTKAKSDGARISAESATRPA